MSDSPEKAAEIEITPEMIEAGRSSFSLHCGAFCDSSSFSEAFVVSEIYTAMRRLGGRDRALSAGGGRPFSRQR